MKNIVLEIKNIKESEEGYTCSLTANGRKVAYYGPDIFEWTTHKAMLEVIEFYGRKFGIKTERVVKLEDDWMDLAAPTRKNLDMQEQIEKDIVKWISEYLVKHKKALKLKTWSRDYVLTMLKVGDNVEIFEHRIQPSELRSPIQLQKFNADLVLGEFLINGLSVEQIAAKL